ncbi:MAG: MerR family DNA-binding transcriptional regulator [Alphaproteobacteria bacterium]|nr:MerR family DNA-binding transcriptional regulator [Alphaproteobacteria bacterium]
MTDTFGIADLAREFGVTTRTIRFYEDRGLILPKRAGQRRVYSARDRVRLKLIMRGKRLGFSLEDIGDMIDLYDVDPSETAQLRLFIDKIGERKKVLERQKSDIAVLLKELEEFEQRSRTLLAEKEGKRKSRP